MTVGEKLKRERKKQKLSLESISEKTKIALIFLIAIEEDDLGTLPGGIYSRNFLRAYARCLAMDEDILTAEFHEQHSTKPISVVHREQTTQDNRSFIMEKRRGILAFLVIVVIFMLLSVLIQRAYTQWNEKREGVKQAINSSSLFEEVESLSDDTLSSEVQPEDGSVKDNLQLEEDLEELEIIADKHQEVEKITEEVPPDTDTMSSETEELPEQGTLKPEVVDELLKARFDITHTMPLTEAMSYTITNDLDDAPQIEALNNVFIIFALKKVWIEVQIDGVQYTRRLLKKGTHRVYRYGNENEISCGDFSRIKLQTGHNLIPTEHVEPGVRRTVMFGQGLLEQSVMQMQPEGQGQE